MLVLTRKRGESIVIANDIKVTVLEVVGNHIRLGFEAPKNVRILRAELEEVRLEPPAKASDQDTLMRPKTMTDIR